MSDSVIQVTDNNFQTEVIEASKPVLIDFWADWCGPCLALAPVLEEIADERQDIIVCKLNVEQNPQVASQFNIRNIPYLAIIKDGQKVGEIIGNQPKEEILKKIDSGLGS